MPACDELLSACLRHELRSNAAQVEGSRVETESLEQATRSLTSVSFCLQPQTYRIYPCAVCGYFLNGKIERTLYIEIIKEYTSKSSKKKSNCRLVKK
jgi:hypothetical protein